MGIISRKIFPACGNMCVCCPALRSSSRQPVKRYKKLLADIFPKSPDELPSERKIVKLCEYAAKNPFRIPKIAKYLEERCYKELRSGHIKLVTIITESFNKLLSICKVQIAYFALDVLNVITELLGYSKDETIQTLGCQSLTRFIFCQVDTTYTHNIEKLVRKVCILSREHGETHEKRCLRASSLQCLSAMVWFMAEFSNIFADFDENLKDRENLVIRFFQLPLSLWTLLLDPSNGTLPPACQRSIFVLSACMLIFACKIYQIHDLNDVFMSLAVSEVDPFLGISDDHQVYAKIHMDVRYYGSAADNQLAMSILPELRNRICKYHQTIKDVLVHNLAMIIELDAENLALQLSETFQPDEEFMFGPQLTLDQNQAIEHSHESLSIDGDFPSNSAGEDDTTSEASVSDISRFIPKNPVSPSAPHVISIGQLMESVANDDGYAQNQVAALPRDPRLAVKLPPASPFDNFLKAAGC